MMRRLLHMARFWREALVAATVFSAGLSGTLAFAKSVFDVSQKGRAFNLKELAIERGDTVNFVNDDEFIHQIFIDSRSFKFDSAESDPGQVIPVEFTAAGVFEVKCHIHPKMLLTVNVK
ncbi:MAG TPA: plastocyanin/azurin family copper-binding protein [Alphaproteobacteria bacterium]|nr:plastocyanin/azurin family copper-binding protein [Alphaproteobacteria bacterium]